MSTHPIQKKSIYEAFSEEDGYRVLIDRVWPRGVSKRDARLAEWMKEIAPSSELRKWFGHDPEKFKKFRERYFRELEGKGELIKGLLDQSAIRTVTLLYGAKDEKHDQAVVLKEVLDKVRNA